MVPFVAALLVPELVAEAAVEVVVDVPLLTTEVVPTPFKPPATLVVVLFEDVEVVVEPFEPLEVTLDPAALEVVFEVEVVTLALVVLTETEVALRTPVDDAFPPTTPLTAPEVVFEVEVVALAVGDLAADATMSTAAEDASPPIAPF